MAQQHPTFLSGLKETREGIQEFTRTVQRNISRRALIVPAEIIAGGVRSRAPVSSSPYDPTPGSLRASVSVVRAISRGKVGGGQVAVLVVDPAAVGNEYGNTRMAAQPFFRPAIDANRGEATAAFGAALKREVEKAAAKAAKKSQAAGT